MLASFGLLALSAGCAQVPAEDQAGSAGAPPAAAGEAADPAKLLTAHPGAATLDGRVSAVLQVEKGCLVVRGDVARTVLWPAGTRISADGRSVSVPGAARPIAIGERLRATGGIIALGGHPAGIQADAIARGCPGELMAVAELTFEE